MVDDKNNDLEQQSKEIKEMGESVTAIILKFLQRHSGWRAVAIIILLICIPGAIVVGYFSWFHGIRLMVAWPSGKFFLVWVPAAFAIMILACLPIWILMVVFQGLGKIVSISLAVQDKEVTGTLDIVAEEEKKFLDSVEGLDHAGLMPLIRYSRIQLEAYYKIGLTQTRRGFLYAVIAMWVGFIFLITGFSIHILPIENLGLIRPPNNINYVILGVGAIIEFVSALFLWIYRSSTSQLTYFYDRQMYTHSVMICFRIAENMKDGDATKKTIVEKVLERKWSPERPTPPSTGRLNKMPSRTT